MASSRRTARPGEPPVNRGGSGGGATATLLGFRFRDPSLLRRALTHRSYCNEHGLEAAESYERLEFLGDAVLSLTISAQLYRSFPEADEGRLTKARARLVSGKALAAVARRWGLGEALRVGRGVDESGGRDQDSVLAAAVESVLGAVYLDRGLEAAREFVSVNMLDELAAVAAGLSPGARPPENPKSRLQELLQGQGRPAPVYRVVCQDGPDHSPVFTVEAVAEGQVIGQGQGGRKSDAERAAAASALAALPPDSPDNPLIPETPRP